MKQRTLHTQVSVIPLLIALQAFACNDERLRELGYTSNPVTASDPGSIAPDPEGCEATLIAADTTIEAVAADIAAAPAENRPFLRYLSLANRLAEGACAEELAREREGVTRLLNSVSRAPALGAPRVGGPLDSIIAIDLRDFALTDPVEVEGRSYPDGWEALLGESAFSVELSGDSADAARLATGTRVPVLAADAFILAATDASLYYALLRVPATLGELRASVGLPSALDPVASGAIRTGLEYSRVLRANGDFRVIDRYEIDSGSAGTYWEATAVEFGVFLADPLHAQPDLQRLVTYSLPNDFFAFALFDAQGQRRASGELVLDTNRNDFTAHVVDSCANCHAQGLIPAIDDAGEAILSHPDQFEPEVVEAYRQGPSTLERAQQFQRDSEPFLAALGNLGMDPSGSNPFVARLVTVNSNVSLDAAAAELLVTPAELRARLGELSPELRPLGLDLNVSRQRFGEHYRSAYCVLHLGDDNPPAAATCEP